MRRLPIYILIDCSESMVGEPIQALETGLAEMLRILRKDPYALEMAYISIISFAATAKQHVPLTELSQFRLPQLVLGSGTALGGALTLLEQRINSEVVKTTAEKKGDYKPLVFIFTDGEPTDSWQSQAEKFLRNRHLQTVVIGCGPDVNTEVLLRISEFAVVGEQANEETFKTFLKWVSTSVATASQSIDSTGKEAKLSLDKLPVGGGIKIVDENMPKHIPEADKHVFLHCTCQKSKKFYLMKYVKSTGKGYNVTGTFKLDNFETVGGAGVNVSTDLLAKVAPCPYCNNPRVGQCTCGSVLCLPEAPPVKPLRIMITQPCYDNIQIVLDGLKLAYSKYKGKFDCDLFFLNCGSSDMERINANELNRFVKDGGILYASDLAYPNIEQAFPGLMTFKGSSYIGHVKANVEDKELQEVVGNTVNIFFDLVPWTVNTISCGQVILRASQSPIMVVCPYGKGKVFYTTFHNHKQTDKKEKALLELLLLKQLGASRGASLSQISGELKINLADYQKTFGTQNAAINTASGNGGPGTKAVCPWCGKESTYTAGTSIGAGAG